MPVIELKTTVKAEKLKKNLLAKKLSQAFVTAGEPDVSRNTLIHIEGDQYICFRGNDGQPSALLVVHPGYLTPKSDYEKLTDGFFRALTEELPDVDPSRMYITFSQIDYWGWDRQFLEP